MLHLSQLSDVVGSTAQDSSGAKLGTVAQVFFDETGQATWVSLRTGFFDATEKYLSARGAEYADGRLVLDVSADHADAAPVVGLHDSLSPSEQAAPPAAPDPVS